MKRTKTRFRAAALLGLAVLALPLASCEKKCESCGAKERRVSVDLCGSAVQVKALDVAPLSEAAVKECALFVFSSRGEYVTSLSSKEGQFDFYLTDGTYDFVAVVNKGGLPSGDAAATLTRRDLMATVTTLSENSVGGFVMAGTLDGHVIQADEKITIEVRRIVAKVTYKVRTQFKGTLASEDFVVEDIYLTNVVGQNDLAVTRSTPAANDPWFNKMNAEGQAAAGYPADLIFGHLGRKFAQPADSIETGHSFYVYPNATTPDDRNKETWSPRCTRFVVRATLGGKVTYYPVTLKEVERNKHYHVDLTIMNYGVDHPEDPPGSSQYVEAMIRIADWEDGGTLAGEFK